MHFRRQTPRQLTNTCFPKHDKPVATNTPVGCSPRSCFVHFCGSLLETCCLAFSSLVSLGFFSLDAHPLLLTSSSKLNMFGTNCCTQMQKHLPVAATNHRTVSGDCPALWRGGAQACLLKINTYMSVAGKPGMRTGPLIFQMKKNNKSIVIL
jgi:hypothetical protein